MGGHLLPQGSGPRSYRGIVVLLVLAVTLGAGACSKRITSVDPQRFPEGVSGASKLIVRADVPVPITRWRFIPPDPGRPDPPDTLMAFLGEIFAVARGTTIGTIIDATPANAFEVFRSRAGEGFSVIKDFFIRPKKRWLNGRVDACEFNDFGSGASYVVRGIVGGAATPNSPLTNVARATGTSPDNSLKVRSVNFALADTSSNPEEVDSSRVRITEIQWTAIPGASAYVIHVYQITEQNSEGIIATGFPSPVLLGRSLDFLIAYIPATLTQPGSSAGSLRITLPLPGGAANDEPIVAEEHNLIVGGTYAMRITAVNSQGEMIGYTGYPNPNDRRAVGLRVSDEDTTTIYIFVPLSAFGFFATIGGGFHPLP